MVLVMWQVCTVLAALCAVGLSLYEDQVGTYDWHHSYVGAVSYISIDQSAKNSRGVVVASEEGLLAVLSPQDGIIRWRQIYEPGLTGNIDAVLRNKYGSLLTVSRGGQLLRSWDISSGLLKYEVPTSLPPPYHARSVPLNWTWRPGGVQAALAGKNRGILVVASGSKITGFVTRSGDQKWTFSIKSDRMVAALYGQSSSVYVLMVVEGKEIEAKQLNASTGAVISTLTFHTPWITHNTTSCLLSGSRLVCVESFGMKLYSTPLTTNHSFHMTSLLSLLPQLDTPTEISLVLAPTPGHVWVQANHTHWLLEFEDETVSVSSQVEVGLPLVGLLDVSSNSAGEAVDVRMEVEEEGRKVLFVYYYNGVRKVGGVYVINDKRGNPIQACLQLYTRSDQSIVFRVVMVMEDDSIVLFGSDASKHWIREDGLGTISAVQFLDLPADQSTMVENFLERMRAERNPIKLASLRWQLQFHLLQDMMKSVQYNNLASILGGGSSELVRDQFNTRKMIVAVTGKGKVYGLDSDGGRVVWQLFFPWLLPFDEGSPLLYILRSTSHPLHPPLAVLIGRSKHPACTHLVLMAFNPLTGSAGGLSPTCLPDIIQALLLSKEDHTHSKIILFLTRELEVVSYPSSHDVISHLTELDEQLFFFVADKRKGVMDGYFINNERTPSLELISFHTSHLWHITFPSATERILSIVHKAMNEHVSAVGRSRVDRSIQYKYLNPNLVAVITESTDSLRPAISVYLVDIVTGGVVFHTSHKAAVPPVHLVHSENWIVYQFLNSKLRRHELVVIELFERDSNQTHTVWSSLTPPPPPEVLSQAYAVPTSFVTMTATQTRRGITAKSLLVGMKSGHVAALPKNILDPRREIEQTDEMKEAGLPPYAPELKFSPLMYINYNRTVKGMRKIYSTASGLESTSLILACGLDLFFTRVLPSKQFDLLAVDFDYILISAVMVAMVIGTVILSKLSARKSLQLLWK